jgi:PAS domain S-box-containing protein
VIGPRPALLFAGLLMVAVFITDFFTPLGFAHGMFYVPVVLLAMTSSRPRTLMAMAGLCVVLIGIGWRLSPPAPSGFPEVYVVLSRLLSMTVVVIVAAFGVLALRHARGLQRARAETHRQTQLLQMACELGQLGAWEYDVRREVLTWSKEVVHLHALATDHTPSLQETLDYFDPADRPRIDAFIEAGIQRAESFDAEFRLNGRDCPTRWVRVVARPVLNGTGEVVRLQGAYQDIDRHKQVQRQLDESVRSWRRLAESMPMMVWTADVDGRLQYASPLVSEYGGLPPGGTTGSGWLQMLHPDDRAKAIAAWQEAVALHQRYERDVRLRRHDGAYRWHLVRAERVQLQMDATPVWYGTAVDIHDHFELELKARVLADRYERVLESVTDAIIAMDNQWRLTVVNSQAEVLLDRSRAELLGQVVWEKFPEARGSRFQQEYERCAHDGVVVRFEEFFPPLDKVFEVTAYPAQGGGVTVYFRDVTEQRQVADQLRRGQRLESIGQLTGSVAHDFNNLLTVVMGNAELLGLQLPEGSEEHELAQTIFEAATKGASMTQRLLAFARRQALSPQAVDVNRLVSNMQPLLRQAVGENIEVQTLPGQALWPALVDPGQLENGLLNLVINARDAMPQGGHLVLETANVSLDAGYAALNPGLQAGDYVMLAVTDNGHGMTPDIIHQLFEPFFTTKPKGRGTGLGLAMVHGFAKQSNGHIAVYSEPGKGTTMRLYLPRIDTPAAAVAEPVPAEVPAGRGECVLLVEDDELVRHYARTLLVGLGYGVVAAEDGHQALKRLHEHPEVQLLFTDMVMPGGIGGRELADRVHALRPDLPVLFTSGYTENGIVQLGQLDPDVLLLAKPYRRSELAHRIRQALDRGLPLHPIRPSPAPL